MRDKHEYFVLHPEKFPCLPPICVNQRKLLLFHNPPFGITTSISIFDGDGSFVIRRVQTAYTSSVLINNKTIIGSEAITGENLNLIVDKILNACTSQFDKYVEPTIDGEVCAIHSQRGILSFYAGNSRFSRLEDIFFRELFQLDSTLPYSTLQLYC